MRSKPVICLHNVAPLPAQLRGRSGHGGRVIFKAANVLPHKLARPCPLPRKTFQTSVEPQLSGAGWFLFVFLVFFAAGLIQSDHWLSHPPQEPNADSLSTIGKVVLRCQEQHRGTVLHLIAASLDQRASLQGFSLLAGQKSAH